MLYDEESYFNELLEEQQKAVARYRRYRTLLLVAGALCIAIAVVWMLMQDFEKDGAMDAFIKAYVPLGGGLITAATSALPIKEIVNRNEKIITYRKLLAIVRRLKSAAAADPIEIAAIHEQMRTVVDTIVKGC